MNHFQTIFHGLIQDQNVTYQHKTKVIVVVVMHLHRLLC